MLGHLYKDFSRHKWIMLSIFCITVFYFTMIITDKSEKCRSNSILSCFIIALPLLLISGFAQVVFSKDEKSNWLKYALSLPGGQSMYVFSKYVFYYLCELIGAFTSIIISLCIVNIKHYVTLPHCILLICILFCFSLSFASIELPFVFKFGAKTGNNMKIIIMLIIFCGLLYYICMGDISYWISKDYITFFRKINSISHVKLIINSACIITSSTLFILSFFLSKKIFRNNSEH